MFFNLIFGQLFNQCNSVKAFLQSIQHVDNDFNANNCCSSTYIQCDMNQATILKLLMNTMQLKGVPNTWPQINGLQVLDLSNNQLAGPLPPISQSLIEINLAFNQFNATFPSYSTNNVQKLFLQGNRLAINNFDLTAMGNLKEIDISGNLFSGTLSLKKPIKVIAIDNNLLGLSIVDATILDSLCIGGNLNLVHSYNVPCRLQGSQTIKSQSKQFIITAQPTQTITNLNDCVILRDLALTLGFNGVLVLCCQYPVVSGVVCDQSERITDINWSNKAVVGSVSSNSFSAFTQLRNLDLRGKQLSGQLDLTPNINLLTVYLQNNMLTSLKLNDKITEINAVYNNLITVDIGNILSIRSKLEGKCFLGGNPNLKNDNLIFCGALSTISNTPDCGQASSAAPSLNISSDSGACCGSKGIICDATNRITEINWSSLGLSELGINISAIFNLTSLNLSSNSITSFNRFNFNRLTTLDLSLNLLNDFGPILDKVTFLNISHNNISMIRSTLGSVVHLDMSYNALNGKIYNFDTLESLDVSFNQFYDYPDSMNHLKSFKTSNNRLSNTFSDQLYPNLTFVDLSMTKINNIIFSNVKSFCNISNTNITVYQASTTLYLDNCIQNSLVPCGTNTVNLSWIDVSTNPPTLYLKGSFMDYRCVDTLKKPIEYFDFNDPLATDIFAYYSSPLVWYNWKKSQIMLKVINYALFQTNFNSYRFNDLPILNPVFHLKAIEDNSRGVFNFPVSRFGQISSINDCTWTISDLNSQVDTFITSFGRMSVPISTEYSGIYFYTLNCTSQSIVIYSYMQLTILKFPNLSTKSVIFKTNTNSTTINLKEWLSFDTIVNENTLNGAVLSLPSFAYQNKLSMPLEAQITQSGEGRLNTTNSKLFIGFWDGFTLDLKFVEWRHTGLSQMPLSINSFPLKLNVTINNKLHTLIVQQDCPSDLYPNVFKFTINDQYPLCAPCPIGSNCDYNGANLPKGQSGYYMTNSGQFIRCVLDEACSGNSVCNTGYKGDLCGECSLGYYSNGNQCNSCPTWSNYMVLLVVVAIFVMLTLLVVKIKYSHILIVFGILVQYLQVLYVYKQLMMKWPQPILDFFEIISIFSFNLELAAPECLNPDIDYFVKARTVMVIPIIFIFSVFLVTGIIELLKRGSLAQFIDLSKSIIHVFLSTFYVILTSFILGYYSCITIKDGDYNYSVMTRQPATMCYKGKHESYSAMFGLGVLVYVVGIPLYFIIGYCGSLQSKYKKLKIRCTNWMTSSTIKDFKEGKEYNVAVYIVFKLILIACQVLLNKVVILQAMLILLMTFFHVGYLLHNKPYSNPAHTKIDTVAQIGCVVTLSCGILFYVLPQVSKSTSSVPLNPDVYQSTLTGVVIATTVVIGGLCFGQMVKDVKQSKSH